MYTGRVVNITKFGAFVNILPGRDGLLHISKLGRGKRIDRVEDVLDLGDEVTVRVDDIDQNGKLSLSLVGDEPEGGGDDSNGERSSRPPRSDRGDRDRGDRGGDRSDRGGGRPRRRRRDRVVRGVLGRRRPARSSATSARPRSRRGGGRRPRPWRPRRSRRPAAAAAAAAALAAVATAHGSASTWTAIRAHAPRLGPARRHRVAARAALGDARLLGRHRRARRARRASRARATSSSTCCSRAPTTRTRARDRGGGRVGRRRDERVHDAGADGVLRARARHAARRSRSTSSPTSCGARRSAPTTSSRSAR